MSGFAILVSALLAQIVVVTGLFVSGYRDLAEVLGSAPVTLLVLGAGFLLGRRYGRRVR